MTTDFAHALRHLAKRADNAERRVALELHGLAAPDRQWILGQLPPVQRAPLESLLRELDALHQPDLMLARDAGMTESTDPPRNPLPSAKDAIDRLDGRLAGSLLGAEPEALVAEVQQQGPFRWQSDDLAQVPTLHRRIEPRVDPVSAGAFGARRREVVLEEFARRARHAMSNSAAAPGSGRPQVPARLASTWRAHLRQWFHGVRGGRP